MNDLVPISEKRIGDSPVQTVNARDLHVFLGIARDFNQWMREQIDRVRLLSERDYLSYEDVGNPAGGRPRKEFALTIDAAKHIAMMSGSDKGFEIREYFIECERRVKSASTVNLNDPAFLRTALLQYTEKVIQLQQTITEQAPKVAFVDKYATVEGNKGVREVVKLLDANEREFVAFLVGTEIMYRLNGRLTAYAHHQHAGRFVVKTGIGGNERAFTQSLFTPRGVQWIAQKWAEYQSAHSSVEAA